MKKTAAFLACALVAVSCDDSQPNKPLEYPPGSTAVNVGALTITAPQNTATTANVPVINPIADLVVTVATNPTKGTLVTNSTFLGVTYTPSAGALGADQATLVVTSASDSSIRFNVPVTIEIIIPFVNVVPESISVELGGTFAFAGASQVRVTHPEGDDLTLTEILSTDIGTLTLGTTTGLEFIEDENGDTSDGTADSIIAFTGSLADVNAALLSLTLTVPAETDPSNVGAFTISSDDGSGGDPVVDAVEIHITGELAVSGPATTQTTAEDTDLVFSSANGNAISVVDPTLASDGLINVTLTGTLGTITLASTQGLTFTTGDGTADATVAFSGTRTNVAAALETVRFIPGANYNGTSARLAVQATSANGSDSLTITINVTAVDDAPTIAVPGSFSNTINSALQLNSPRATSVTDLDGTTFVGTLTFTVSAGTLAVGNNQGYDVNTSTPGQVVYTASGGGRALSALNTSLSSITWTAPASAGPAQFTVTIRDGSNNVVATAQFSATVTSS